LDWFEQTIGHLQPVSSDTVRLCLHTAYMTGRAQVDWIRPSEHFLRQIKLTRGLLGPGVSITPVASNRLRKNSDVSSNAALSYFAMERSLSRRAAKRSG
jgi:hypothetical protein